jgi:hypothetical protein
MKPQFAPCPKCSAASATQLKFTWWGGALGPKLLTHVRCDACGNKFNGKTGGDNTTKIVIYFLVVGLVFFVIFFVAALAFVVMR